jgi:hypothetical protein
MAHPRHHPSVGSVMSASSHYRRLPLLALLVAFSASCSAADFTGVPSSQEWLVIDNQNTLGRITTTYLNVIKGGAASQGGGAYRMDVTGTCSFLVPLSGNWNGSIVRLTSTGGGCGVGYILTMDGTANGEYGDATLITGTYRVTYSGGWTGGDSGTWRATPAR